MCASQWDTDETQRRNESEGAQMRAPREDGWRCVAGPHSRGVSPLAPFASCVGAS
jgi:hypothetical protein